MTTIIILGQPVSIAHTVEIKERLTNYHVRLTQTRFQWELEAVIKKGKPFKLADLPDFDIYKFELMHIDKAYKRWSIYDDRLLLFLDDFVNVVGADVRLLWIDTPPETDHDKKVANLAKKAFAGYKGAKLKLSEVNHDKINEWVGQPTKVVETKPLPETQEAK